MSEEGGSGSGGGGIVRSSSSTQRSVEANPNDKINGQTEQTTTNTQTNTAPTGTANSETKPFPKCSGCLKGLEGGKAIRFADGVWHIECFRCSNCDNLIQSDASLLFLAEGKPICQDCSYCCSLCKQLIYDEAIFTVEGTYHSECFRCAQCKKRIQGKSFAKTSQCYSERRERKKASRKQKEQILLNKALPSIPQDNNIVHHPHRTSSSPHERSHSSSNIGARSSESLGKYTAGLSTSHSTREKKENGFLRSFFTNPTDSSGHHHHHRSFSRSSRRGDASAQGTGSDAAMVQQRSQDFGSTSTILPAPRFPSFHFDVDTSVFDSFDAMAMRYTRTSLRLNDEKVNKDTQGVLFSSQEFVKVDSKGNDADADADKGADDDDGEKWLMSATAEQLRQELVITQNHLDQVKTNYNILKTMYESAADSLSEVQAQLKKNIDRSNDQEELIEKLKVEIAQLKKSAGGPGSSTSTLPFPQDIKSGRASQDSSLPTLSVNTTLGRERGGSLSANIKLDSGRPPVAPKSEGRTHYGGSGVPNLPSIPLPDTLHIPVPGKKLRHVKSSNSLPSEPENSDGEDGVITPIVPKPVGKRFNWLFNGSSHNHGHPRMPSGTPAGSGSTGRTIGKPQPISNIANPHRAGNSGFPGINNNDGNNGQQQAGRPHMFQLQAFLKPTRCDACGEKIWGINTRDLRCKACSYNCHTKCAALVPLTCPGIDYQSSYSNNSNVYGGTGNALNSQATTNGAQNPGIDIFGVPLTTSALREKIDIPWMVRSSIAFIEKYGIRMEGVYRKSGSSSEIKNVQQDIAKIIGACNYHLPIASSDIDVTTITSIVKQYFRDLPDPLMTFDAYPNWIRSTGLENREERINGYREACNMMPVPHQCTLVYLLTHLNLVTQYSEFNKMNSKNLAVVFAPNILHLPKSRAGEELMDMAYINQCVSFLIENAYEIWPSGVDGLNKAANPKVKSLSKVSMKLNTEGNGDNNNQFHSHQLSPSTMAFFEEQGFSPSLINSTLDMDMVATEMSAQLSSQDIFLDTDFIPLATSQSTKETSKDRNSSRVATNTEGGDDNSNGWDSPPISPTKPRSTSQEIRKSRARFSMINGPSNFNANNINSKNSIPTSPNRAEDGVTAAYNSLTAERADSPNKNNRTSGSGSNASDGSLNNKSKSRREARQFYLPLDVAFSGSDNHVDLDPLNSEALTGTIAETTQPETTKKIPESVSLSPRLQMADQSKLSTHHEGTTEYVIKRQSST
ncbi:Rho-type gtpase-activating protein [Mycoemilia scoparia]|uniref:Rho-type gtpase-activating protein n=1 Tax=Mycoemilia scoparia TaxID=417184 RepID=A0A9W8DR07_9FUNG|nr:Rho-type gtpase-activating protein [Mycoemilia scoparia]